MRGKSAAYEDHTSYDTTPFYDAVVDHYQLFYRDWLAAVEREGMTLRRALGTLRGQKVLDASCGIGTQTLALAKLGCRVTASDINASMLEKARENAAQAKVGSITFVQAGFLDLRTTVNGTFDAIITKGNALPHLLTDAELTQALFTFRDLLKPGGKLIIGIRDYDTILEDRIRFVPGQFHDNPAEQHILFDIWDYDDGPPTVITFNKFRVSGEGEDYAVVKHSVKYRALRRAELEAMLAAAGFTAPTVETQYWELIFTATKQ